MISRVIAGWPALALLIAVKLLSGILNQQATAPGRPRNKKTGPPTRTVPARGRTATTGPSRRPAQTEGTANPHVPAEATPILSAARTARDQLHQQGQPLTRDTLAHHLRHAGYQVRNSRLTPLLQTLRNDAA